MLYDILLNQVLERIKVSELNIISAKSTAENETKSSAGDKYETAREMMQQEISMNQNQLVEANRLKHALSLVNPGRSYDVVCSGSLVYTNIGIFYISIGGNPIILKDIQYQPISSVSPIAKALAGKRKEDQLEFKQKIITVLNVL